MNSKTTHQTQLSLWYTTAAVAAVGGGLACTANEAAADIVNWNSGLTAGPSFNFPVTDLNGGVWFNFISGKSDIQNFTDAQFRLQWNTQSPGFTNIIPFITNTVLGNGSLVVYPSKLAKGASIGPTGQWAATFSTGNAFRVLSLVGDFGNWNNNLPTTGYLGLRFGSPSNYNYGWAEVSIAAADPSTTPPTLQGKVTLDAFGYETVLNTPILAGALPPTATPEPNPLLLLATGAAGLGAYRAWRARRDQRRAPEAVTT